jgi:acetate kinase
LLDDHIKYSLKYIDKIDAVILVGGLGSSKYLKMRLMDRYNSMNIEVNNNPKEGLNAISQGAVSYALDQRMISRLNVAEEQETLKSSESISKENGNKSKGYINKADLVIGIG